MHRFFKIKEEGALNNDNSLPVHFSYSVKIKNSWADKRNEGNPGPSFSGFDTSFESFKRKSVLLF